MTEYAKLELKIPQESPDYASCSAFIVARVEQIMRDARDTGRNKIVINTNLRHGIPMENINKIAGPFVEAWAFEVFQDALESEYQLIHLEAGQRLNMADMVLQFRYTGKHQSAVTGHVDVKATSEDIKNSGKSLNITSFARIRTAYLDDPDYVFVILSIRHKVYSQKDLSSKLMMGVMEVVGHSAYDLKYIAASDISLNPALGSGQLQIKDIHHVSEEKRSTWEFCQLLDQKFIATKKGFAEWQKYAKQYSWVKS